MIALQLPNACDLYLLTVRGEYFQEVNPMGIGGCVKQDNISRIDLFVLFLTD